ncbi:hypothetical protein ALC57_06274, partial [Trachymyrmex cornetzi]
GGENPRAIPSLNRAGKEGDAALQGLGGRVLETPRSFLAIECESNGSSETCFLCVLLDEEKCFIWETMKTKGISSTDTYFTSNAQQYVDIVTILHSKLTSMLEHFVDFVLSPFQWNMDTEDTTSEKFINASNNISAFVSMLLKDLYLLQNIFCV